ncbi:MAG: adenylate/guanylate cyclase domain-containing protein [Pseudomonadota bacterium]
MVMRTQRSGLMHGVRGRLLLAFLVISMFSLVAAASGFFSFAQFDTALSRITEERVPQALSLLDLSRQAERVVRAAPALLVVTNENARAEVSAEIAAEADRLNTLLQHIRDQAGDDQDEQALAGVSTQVDNLSENLLSLDELVKQRLSIANRKEKLLRHLASVNNIAQRTMGAGIRILGGQLFEWERSDAATGTAQLSPEQSELARSMVHLIPQVQGAALVEAINNILLSIASVDDAAEIGVLLFPLQKALAKLTDVAQNVPKRARDRLVKQIVLFEALAVGPNSLGQVRQDELAVLAQAEQLLAVNVSLSKILTNEVDGLVKGTSDDISDARTNAENVLALNSNVLIGVVALSLISSILIVWLYVGRNLIARLTALSDSMLAIAGGNLRASLPKPGGDDEIGRMAEALVVFRDTAIEVEESNLREIEIARRRLMDAIENISEGFAFYDSDDRLVVSNTRYHHLLYPGEEVSFEPGTKFEAIVRRSAESGQIEDAEGRVDEWIAERLGRHRNPQEPHLQKRADGRWILISERKTGDGGTVAIYSDITDLKQREEELAQKSSALERLSNQLAKYLSPQVYDSIFSGKQEVKLVSKRKRLTVFFSDLVGFTETTERLESEDLTRLLNHYLTEMSEIALAHGATIDKYMGDAIVIFFGDPETLGVKEDAVACVTMALAMRKRMQELESVWMEAGLERPLRCRMGINTGLCTVGNFGSDDRMDYTIIGGGVNLAARLETACPANEILISYETYAHVKDQIECRKEGQIEVKGMSHPVSTHRVIDLYKNLDEGRQPIRAKGPHLRIDVDVDLMSASEQREAAGILQEAADRLARIGTKD